MRVSKRTALAGFALALGAGLCLGQTGEGLRDRAKQSFTALPEVMASPANPITPEKVSLGKALFYERRFSSDGLVSCWRCHPISLYAADGLKTSVGNSCKVGPRNAPTLFNAAGQIAEHWIGNRRDVEEQAALAVTAPGSFNMPSDDAVEKALEAIPGYAELFRNAFPGETRPVSVANLGKAIGAFERTLVTPSRFDAFLKGDDKALGEAERRGLSVFMETGCSGCHNGAYVGGGAYQKFGVVEPYWNFTKSSPIDTGRYDVTKKESDRYVFKVPPLRNVVQTSPYFHDGSVARLEESVRIMAKVQLGKDLDEPSVLALHAFLGSLTGRIPEDALKVPILPASR